MTLVGSVRRIAAALMALMTMAVATHAQDINDYPTSARVEYVFGCLKANGETRQAIEQCSCSIDVVASLLPYQRYITAETVLSMSQVRGNMGGPFRTSEQAASALNDLRRAQAEAEVRCFLSGIRRLITSRNRRSSIRAGRRVPRYPLPRRGSVSRHWTRR